jgi:uncharacterized protein with HEPN domain
MKTKTKKQLLDALTACQAIQSFVADYTLADYEQNLMMRSAVERQTFIRALFHNNVF